MSRTVVILLGAPGAGKGTQATRLAGALGLPHVSTGDLFRENLAQGTALGEQARGFMEKGVLVPDSLVIDMLFDRVGRPDCAEGYLLDGFPRTVPQTEALAQRLGQQSVAVVDIQVPDELILDRITGRLTCKACGNIHHRTFSPPRAEGLCDRCGGSLVTRDDDREDVVRKRLSTYHEQTAPVAAWYGQHGGVCSVDGTRTPDEVFQACLDCIGKGASA